MEGTHVSTSAYLTRLKSPLHHMHVLPVMHAAAFAALAAQTSPTALMFFVYVMD